LSDLLWGERIVRPNQLQNEAMPRRPQVGMSAGHAASANGVSTVGGMPRACHFRVKHSSGETVCGDLETARLLQRQKPGAKIFLERHG